MNYVILKYWNLLCNEYLYTMKNEKLIGFLENVASFSSKEKILILNCLEERKKQKGDFLLEMGQISTEIHFVTKGVVRFFIISEKGEELTTAFISEDEVAVRIESFLRNSPSNGFLQCETSCEFITITKDNWNYLCAETKNFGYAMTQLASIYVAKKMEIQRRLLTADAHSAYMDFLKYHGNIADRVPLKHISSYLGITPSSLSRIKKDITDI